MEIIKDYVNEPDSNNGSQQKELSKNKAESQGTDEQHQQVSTADTKDDEQESIKAVDDKSSFVSNDVSRDRRDSELNRNRRQYILDEEMMSSVPESTNNQ